MLPYSILKKRRDFVRVSKEGRFKATPFFVLQSHPRENLSSEPSSLSVRFGVTASKKIGCAVERNRAKRRLRALFRDSHLHYPQKNIDIVLVARKLVLEAPFTTLRDALEKCLKELST